MSENLSRRSILRLGGLATGLLLPFAGGQALSVVDKKSAADLVVKRTPFSMSPQMARFWTATEELAYFGKGFLTGDDDYESDYRTSQALHKKMETAAATVWARPCVSWGDVAERAEIAWTAAPKEETWTLRELNHHYEPQRFTGRLLQGEPDPRMPDYANRYYAWGRFHIDASAALIEGVLSMSAGRRFAPCIEHDRRASEWNRDYQWRPLDCQTGNSRPQREA